MSATAREPPQSIEGPKIAYRAGGVHPKTRTGRCFVALDKDVFARVLRPMRVEPGPPVAPQILDAREAEGPCDTHRPDKQKDTEGGHTVFKGTMKGTARLTVTMAKGPHNRV